MIADDIIAWHQREIVRWNAKEKWEMLNIDEKYLFIGLHHACIQAIKEMVVIDDLKKGHAL